MATATEAIRITDLKAVCSTCSLRELCLPIGLDARDLEALDNIVQSSRVLQRGSYLYRGGDDFNFLYAVRSGSLKTSMLNEEGREHVTGFHMVGELLGIDAISKEAHDCSAVALEYSTVCEIPFTEFETLTRAIPTLHREFNKIMSREIIRDHQAMMLLSCMNAEERVASFLLNVSQRLHSRGFSKTRFRLSMTRDDIGSYLGVKLETVSRTLSRFRDEELIEIHNKEVEIKNFDGLSALLRC